jgi:hypothetical protein
MRALVAWQDAKSNNLISNVTVFASSGQSLSFVRKYYDEGVGVFPYLTAIVDVQDGVSDACINWNVIV